MNYYQDIQKKKCMALIPVIPLMARLLFSIFRHKAVFLG